MREVIQEVLDLSPMPFQEGKVLKHLVQAGYRIVGFSILLGQFGVLRDNCRLVVVVEGPKELIERLDLIAALLPSAEERKRLALP